MAKLEVATSTAEPTSPRFKELEVVNLADDFDGPDGRIPRGTQGTVLQVFGRGEAYQIEFAKVFQSYGFTPAEWSTRQDAISKVPNAKADSVRQDEYGTTYRTAGPLETPSGRRAKVEVFWIVRADDLRPQLTTVIPRGRWRED